VPFYLALGVRGMFVINALAYVLAIALCYRVALQLLPDRTTALIAAGLLASTYFTEYAFAVWPHATSVATTLGAVSLAIEGSRSGRRAVWFAAAAGLVAGIGATFRLDALFVVPALCAHFLFASPARLRELSALVVGLMPGLGLNAATNYARWESLSPVSYGPQSSAQLVRYLVFAIAAGGVALLGWWGSRPARVEWLRVRGKQLAVAALVVLVAGLLVPRCQNIVRGIVAVTIDLRLRADDTIVIWHGDHKRALLQSCPFLVLAFVAVARAIRERRDLASVAWLGSVALIPIAFYGAFSWNGGLGMNMRYLLPAVPFLCILAAMVVRDMLQQAPLRWPAACAAVGAAVLLFATGPPSDVLSALLLAAIGLLVAIIAYWHARPTKRSATAALAVIGLTVGSSVAVTTRDAVWSRDARARNYRVTEALAPHLPEGALLFGIIPDPFYGLIEHVPGLRIAVFLDDMHDAERLIRTELGRGRRVFACVPPGTWTTLDRMGALRGVKVQPIDRIGLYLFGELHAQ
jgi:hypothetical protein